MISPELNYIQVKFGVNLFISFEVLVKMSFYTNDPYDQDPPDHLDNVAFFSYCQR